MDDLQSLRNLLIERLALMEQVAAFKWNKQQPIDDPVREANVLKAAVARARAAGLDAGVARRFTVAQMEAAKMAQRHHFETWQEEAVEIIPDTPDLETELRPKIGALSVELISAMAKSHELLESCTAVAVLEPVPDKFSNVSQAWATAVEGVVGDQRNCP